MAGRACIGRNSGEGARLCRCADCLELRRRAHEAHIEMGRIARKGEWEAGIGWAALFAILASRPLPSELATERNAE